MVFMFEKLGVYKKSMSFVVNVYALCGSLGQLRDRTLIDQLQRAALSVPLNIAEGNGRIHSREKRQFFFTARASLLECVPVLQLCREVQFLEPKKFDDLYLMAEEIGKMLSGLIKSVKEGI